MATVNVSSFQIPNWRYGGSTAKLRLYSNIDWIDSDGTPHLHGSVGCSRGFYQEVNLTVSGSTVTVPSFTTPSTADARDPSSASSILITGVLFDSKNVKREILFSSFQIQTTTPITYDALVIRNRARSLPSPPARYLDATQVQSLIDSAVGTLSDASDVVKGRTYLSVAPVSAGSPIAVSDNDPRVNAVINVKSYATGDGVTDDGTAITTAITAAVAANAKLIFPAGTYAYATCPNFGVSNLTIEAQGRVVLKHTGTGHALKISSTGSDVNNLQALGFFIVQGNASTHAEGVLISRVHRSRIELIGQGAPGAMFTVEFAVLSDMYLISSVNLEAFSVTPTTGVVIKEDGVGEYTTVSNFHLIMEGINGIGVDVQYAYGCTFTGTSESNNMGLRDTANAVRNTYNDFWFEGNGDKDAELNGKNTVFNNVHSASFASVTENFDMVAAQHNKFIGGFIRKINLQAGSEDTYFEAVAFQDHALLGIQGTGVHRRLACIKVDGNLDKTDEYTDILSILTSFTPALVGDSTAGTQTYDTRVGFYNRIGNQVTVSIYIALTAKGGSMAGDVVITDLPIPAISTISYQAAVNIGEFSNITLTAGRTLTAVILGSAPSKIYLKEVGSGVASQTLGSSAISNTSALTITATYIVAD